jgi:tetratricopeptide (TPR) repeat protein
MRPEEVPPAGITVEDWANTPPAVRAWAHTIEQRLARLEERVNQTSRNSSKPPSADPPTLVRPTPSPSGRQTGGQPGHPGHGRKLKPVEQVDRIVDAKPAACGQCGSLLLGEDPQPIRHQVTELPVVTPVVTEYRCHTLACLICGAQTQAPWPQDMPPGSFGPRLQATTGFLTGRIGGSHREVQEVLATVFQAEVSVGSIAGLEQAVSEALATPVAEAARYVQEHHVRNADETGWRERAKRVWLWISTTPLVTVFRILASRGAASAKEVLGEDFPGVAGARALGIETGTGLPQGLAVLAEAYGKVGQAEEGLKVVAEALTKMEKSGDRYYEAELYRLKGELTLQQSSVQGLASRVQANQRAKGNGQKAKMLNPHPLNPHPPAEAEACFRKAIEIARQQSAKSWELRAVMSLARLWQQQGKRDEARQLLAEIYGWFTEGFETKDLQEAKALLAELGWVVRSK